MGKLKVDTYEMYFW